MRRKGDFSGDIARKENYYKAFDHASKNKHGKKAIIKFEADLEKNLSDLLYSFESKKIGGRTDFEYHAICTGAVYRTSRN